MPAEEERNLEIMRRFVDEVLSKENLEVADEIVAPDIIQHVFLPVGWPEGAEGIKRNVVMFRDAFPDFTYTLDDMVAEDDLVVCRTTFRGTNTGSLFGQAPSFNKVVREEMHIMRMKDGIMVEHWSAVDILGMMQALGLAHDPKEHAAGGHHH